MGFSIRHVLLLEVKLEELCGEADTENARR